MPSFPRLFIRDLPADFSRLCFASLATNLGDGALLAAGPLLVASLTTSPGAVGAAVVVQQLPWLLFSLFSGVIVDRLDRRRLVIVVNVCRSLVLVTLTVLIAFHVAPLGAIYSALFLLGTGETLADNAVGALTVSAVRGEDLGRANAQMSLTFTVGNQVAGPPLGALLFAVGHALPFGFHAVAFALAAFLVWRTALHPARLSAEGPPVSEASHVLTDLAVGLRWVSRHSALRILVVSIAVMDVVFAVAFVTWVLYGVEVLGLTNFQFGLLITSSAIGGLAGPAVYGWAEPRFGRPTLVRFGMTFEAMVHLALATTPPAWAVYGIMAAFGVHTMVWGAAFTTLRQQATPDALLGRVTSVYMTASVGGAAIGSALGALIAEYFGLTAGFWIGFITMCGVAALSWRPLAALETDSPRTNR